MPNSISLRQQLSRRTFLSAGLSGAALLALAGCTPTPAFLSPTSARVAKTEAARKATGATTKVALRASTGAIDLAGTSAQTWSFGSIPAPIIRLAQGDELDATIQNTLPDATTVHWHGLALRNDMDGVPNLTQDAIAAGSSFRYRFTAPHPGTYWFHPHVGTQIDRGLYGALIIEDPREPLAYDDEWVVILDDWLDGVTATPEEVLAELSKGMKEMAGMEGMMMRMGNTLMGAESDALGGDAGDVYYPHYLINGRPPADPETYTSAPGKRVRIRMINAGGDTAFRVALAGHTLTVTHTDGFPVEPLDVDSVLVGMGERYDVIVTLGDGAFAFVAEAEGKNARAFAVVRTGSGATPASNVTVSEITGRLATADGLRAASEVVLPNKKPDRELTIRLRGSMKKYDWSLDGRPFTMDDPMIKPYSIAEGERVRVNFVNTTSMWHPMHLHGHTFQHAGGGPRKDTSIVLPDRTLTVDFDADNPGRWLAHCHNIYHGEVGMMGVFAYTG
ncbi:multicopper oxidase family protein [Mycetocola manganoxydans]|uniref:Multicopper oxidase family protein n=1 Tax=Mycetocola manganoxydans TaxID=699879 RepID=A0A3L6ZV02_9MICO|nr:multicopper oxidase family protein [Mycetocola manganoxydans]RLP71381.1 multicopper oxidase family protein [Mycetocola manganoxydans]GHD46131.1 putative oxidase (copper-binding protein) [Mycetocola manganoxydans]